MKPHRSANDANSSRNVFFSIGCTTSGATSAKRLHDKTPLMHQRMGQGQVYFSPFCSENIKILLYYRIAIKQQVNSNRSVDIRPTHTLATPPQFTVGRLRNTENLFRRLLCTQYCHGIQKRVVRAEPPKVPFS